MGPDRTPPHDNAAEQSVLGAMLLSKDAIADVVEILREGDFYRPNHQVIYGAILDLYGRGEPVDAVTLSAELTRIGELVRVGGAPYLHTLVQMVPTAANGSYYGTIVREKAILRRLVEAGCNINATDSTGDTPLHFAAKCGFPLVVKFLLDNNATYALANSAGMTPAQCSVSDAVKKTFPEM
jgi:replicative DNA helicase